MTEPLAMTLQERMTILSFACKSAEMLENGMKAAAHPTNADQWQALATEARKVLRALDALPENNALLPVPHDGRRWRER